MVSEQILELEGNEQDEFVPEPLHDIDDHQLSELHQH